MKNKLILLVSMLLPLVSSCGEKPTVEPTSEIVYNYKESIHTDMSATMYQYAYESEPVINQWIGFGTLQSYSIDDFSYVKVNDEKFDYYTCGYMKNEIYDKLSEYTYSPIANREYGIDNSLAKYNRFLTHNEKNDNPIKWYDVKIDSTIPLEIDGYTLVIINSLVKMDVFDFSYNYVDSFIIMHEKASFKEYDIGDEDRDEQIQYENFISNYIKDSICLQMSSLLVYDKIMSASAYYGHIYSAYGKFVEERENDAYVTIYALNENDYIINGHNALQDIPNTNLSTERDIKYEFNVKDLISFIKNSL
jgi:hypothetical protein